MSQNPLPSEIWNFEILPRTDPLTKVILKWALTGISPQKLNMALQREAYQYSLKYCLTLLDAGLLDPVDTDVWAAYWGNTVILDYIKHRPKRSTLPEMSVRRGHFDAVIWMTEQGWEITPQTVEAAISTGQLKILQHFATEHPIPLRGIEIAERYKQIEVVEWLKSAIHLF